MFDRFHAFGPEAPRPDDDRPDPRTEAARLASLARYRPEALAGAPALDALLDAARAEFDVPMAALTLVGEDRQTAVAARGFDAPLDAPRAESFCRRPVANGRPLYVEDAREDPRFRGAAFVAGPFGLRFYAGAPVRLADGHVLGALCLIDTRPRRMPEPARLRLLAMAAAAQEMIAAHGLALDLLDAVSAEARAAARDLPPALAAIR